MRSFEQELVPLIPRLRRYAVALTGNRGAADDLVQDTLTRALDRQHLWRPHSDRRAWLFTVMHNLFVNQVKKSVQKQAAEPVLSGAAAATPDQADRAVRLHELEQALARLPSEQREVLLMVSLEGFSYQEAADILSIPQGTIMSRLSRARERMRQLMQHELQHPLRSVK